jgi:hypothetical protein
MLLEHTVAYCQPPGDFSEEGIPPPLLTSPTLLPWLLGTSSLQPNPCSQHSETSLVGRLFATHPPPLQFRLTQSLTSLSLSSRQQSHLLLLLLHLEPRTTPSQYVSAVESGSGGMDLRRMNGRVFTACCVMQRDAYCRDTLAAVRWLSLSLLLPEKQRGGGMPFKTGHS